MVKAHNKRRANGSAIGRAPWGFDVICTVCNAPSVKPRCRDHKKLFIPNELGRKWIPAIYGWAVDKETMRAIAVRLTEASVPTMNGRPWNESFLARLIANPVYYGERRNGGELETEALVSATTWQEANAAVRLRARPGRTASVHEKALLKPVCGECLGVTRDGCLDGRSPMYRNDGGYGEHRQSYYRCSGHGPQKKGCGTNLPMAKADADVVAVMLDNGDMHLSGCSWPAIPCQTR